MQTAQRSTARHKLLLAAVDVVRAQGYAATSIDDLCLAAGVTKGAFFHHFKSKEDLAVAAAGYWAESTGELFAAAPYHALPDPVARLLGYIDFRSAILVRGLPAFTCLAGTMVQETYGSHPAIRDACARAIISHAAKVESDIEAAIAMRGIVPPWTAASLALHMQAVLQGAFILAKATGEVATAAACLAHLRRYVEMLFPALASEEKTP